ITPVSLALFARGLCRRLWRCGCGLLCLQRGPPPAGVLAGILQLPARAFGVGFAIGSAGRWCDPFLCCWLSLRIDYLGILACGLLRERVLYLHVERRNHRRQLLIAKLADDAPGGLDLKLFRNQVD